MLSAIVLCLVVVAVCAFVTGGGAAKRAPKPVVPPVEIAGVQYRAPNTFETEGCVEAWDTKSQTLLWRKKVYYSVKIPFLEEDVQWVFIKSMTLSKSGDGLIVVNEAGRQYTVNTTPQNKFGILSKIGALLLCFVIVYLVFRFWSKRSTRGGDAV